jgi:hypothetical protein
MGEATPFFQWVNDICDRVLREAQMDGNVLTNEEGVPLPAAQSGQQNSDSQLPIV